MPALVRLLSSRPLWPLVATVVALSAGDALLARLFWFEALGYDAVFRRILLLKAGLIVAAALPTYAYAFLNLAVLRRQVVRAPASRSPASGPWTPAGLPASPALRARWLPAAAALAPAVVVGLVAAGSWDTVLRFLWARPF